MDIKKKIYRKLIAQDSRNKESERDIVTDSGNYNSKSDYSYVPSCDINTLKNIAWGYTITENSIAVLSDLRNYTNHIYHSELSEIIGIGKNGEYELTYSIWEEKIFNRIHPDDLSKKHINELQFYNFIKGLPFNERKGYYVRHNIRMQDNHGTYLPITHRIFYFYDKYYKVIKYALCLYNLNTNTQSDLSFILNTISFKVIHLSEINCSSILSDREKEILSLIDKGMSSKEISEILSISKNTVSRHRQNIIEKLQVRNSVEACKIAKDMKLII